MIKESGNPNPNEVPGKTAEQLAYDDLSQRAPPRAVAISEKKTLGEATESLEDLTDMQYALAKMFPKTVDASSAMIGRIDPGIFLSALHLVSVNEIMQQDPTKPIDVNRIYMDNYIRLSIGLDGRGRIDIAELLGAAREEKKAEAMLRGGGI